MAGALEPADMDERSWLWAGNWIPPMLEDVPQCRPLLLKMTTNIPLNVPFSIQWAMTYVFPGEENGEFYSYIIDVRDVHHIPFRSQYILCGQFIRGNIKGAFLLKMDWDGYLAMDITFYSHVGILNSVVTKSNSDTGNIAVGSTLRTKEDPPTAVYLSVDWDLNPLCVNQVHGSFQFKGDNESYYKKVIPYDEVNFATVGGTRHSPGTHPI